MIVWMPYPLYPGAPGSGHRWTIPITGLGVGKRSASERNLWRSISTFHSGRGVLSGIGVILSSFFFEASGRASWRAEVAPERACAARPTSLSAAARLTAPLLRVRPANFDRRRRPWLPGRLRHSRRWQLRSRASREVAL